MFSTNACIICLQVRHYFLLRLRSVDSTQFYFQSFVWVLFDLFFWRGQNKMRFYTALILIPSQKKAKHRGHRTHVVRQPVKIIYYRTGFIVEALPHIKYRHWTTALESQPRLSPRAGACQEERVGHSDYIKVTTFTSIRKFVVWFGAIARPEGTQTALNVTSQWSGWTGCHFSDGWNQRKTPHWWDLCSNTVPGGLRWGEAAFSVCVCVCGSHWIIPLNKHPHPGLFNTR